MDVRIGSKGGRVGGAPPFPSTFAKRGKWLRIGCRMRQDSSNLYRKTSSNFKWLDLSDPSHNPKVPGSNPGPATKLDERDL